MASEGRGKGAAERGIPREYMGAIEAAARMTAVFHWRNDAEPGEGHRGGIPAKVAGDMQAALGYETCRNGEDTGYTVRPVAGFDPGELAGPAGCLPTALVCRLALGLVAPALAKLGPDAVLAACSKAWAYAGDEMARPEPGTRGDFIGGPSLAAAINRSRRKQAGA